MTRFLLVFSLIFSSSLVFTSCSDEKEPFFDCDCTGGAVCRDGVCVVPDATDDGRIAGDFVNNPDCPAAGVVINELQPKPNTGEPEFVEITGPSGSDLTGFRLIATNGNGATEVFNIRLIGPLTEEGFYLVATSEFEGADQLSEDLVMQNGPDNLRLLDCGGQLVDSVGYGDFTEADVFQGEGDPAPNMSNGESIGRCDSETPDTNDNLSDFHIIETPTPGAPNDNFEDAFACAACEADQFHGAVIINEVLPDPEGTDSVDTEFVELAGPAGMDTFGLELVFINGADGSTYERTSIEGIFDENGLFVVGGAFPNAELGGTLQNGPDGVTLLDCNGDAVDALGYGDFSSLENSLGEGTSAPKPGSGESLARCPDGIDNDNNQADFSVATPSPGDDNGGFLDPRSCGGISCPDGVLDGRLWISEVAPGLDGFVELAGEPSLGLADVAVEIYNGSGSLIATLDASGSTSATGFSVLEADAINASGGSVVLLDCNGEVLDTLGWGDGSDLFTEGLAASSPAVDQALARCSDVFDAGDNSLDYHITATPTAGEANEGFVDEDACAGADCVPGAMTGAVIINEVSYDPDGTDSANAVFIELRGVPGTPIQGGTLIKRDGSSGSSSDLTELFGAIPTSGLYVIGQNVTEPVNIVADVDLVNTRGGVEVRDCEGVLIDAMGYGDTLADGIAEGGAADGASEGESLARCPTDDLDAADTGDNSVDFHRSTSASPGSANYGFIPRGDGDGRADCDPTCISGLLEGNIWISEVVPGAGGYVELSGTAGLPLYGVEVVVQGDGGADLASLTPTSDEAMTGETGLFVLNSDQIPRASGTVTLVDCEGQPVDAVAWGDGVDLRGEGDPATAPGGTDAGLARCSNHTDSDDNADDFHIVTTATPNAANANFEDSSACNIPASPLAGDYLINELVVDPAGDDGSGVTFIELRGTPEASLSGFQLLSLDVDDRSVKHSVELSSALGSDGLYTLGANDPSADLETNLVTQATNSEGIFVLVDEDGLAIDAVAYGSAEDGLGEGNTAPAIDGNTGRGLARCPGDLDAIDTHRNDVDFVVDDTPTPGATNDPEDCL